MEVMDLFSVRSFLGNISFSHSFSPSRGASGGTSAIWDLDRIHHSRLIINDWFVAVEAVDIAIFSHTF